MLSVPRVALVTWSGLPELSEDDRLLRAQLEDRGVVVDAAVWDDPRAGWERYDAVIVRSTWDYHRREREFRDWLEALEAAGVPLWNPPALLRWNLHKQYLVELAARGVAIVPSVLVRRGSTASLQRILDAERWSRVVVKPAVSATAWKTVAAATEAGFAELVAETDVLVQPFLDEVCDVGEWSLIFIAGQFSHAVIKRPRSGDFRVQADFGGTADDAVPPAPLVEQARAVLREVQYPWLYARVDGVERDGRLLLMELEMAEPSLFLRHGRHAASRFADAILGTLCTSSRFGREREARGGG